MKRNKKGSYIMEAAIVLPMIIFATITAILIIMFFYSQMTDRCRLHLALRNEAGAMTENTVYTVHAEDCEIPEAELYRKSSAIGGEVYGKKYLVMEHRGLLDEKGSFTVEGSCYAIDGVTYVRYCNMAAGGGNGKNE